MRNVKLADGSIYPVDKCGTDGDALYINVTEGDFLDIVLLFGDPKRTASIEHYFDGTETDHVFFDGYTALISASITKTGVTLILKRG